MPGNVYTYQVLKDTTERAVIKLTAKFDGTGQENNPHRITANTLSGALDSSRANLLSDTANTGPLSYYNLSLHRLWYDCINPANADVEIFWNSDNSNTALMLSGTYEYDGNSNWVTIANIDRGTANCNGDIGVRTRGMVANNSYTIIIELRKDNYDYQRGQFNDPAAFNYPPYGLKP